MTDTVLSELPRHPLDPDPARSSKATAVLALGVVAALTGVLVGGLVPAAVALLLAREARADILAARGFLVGTRRLRTGIALAWLGIVLAVAALVTASIIGLLHFAQPGGTDFRPTVN
jgi:(hydroxyamino)benzene mutase